MGAVVSAARAVGRFIGDGLKFLWDGIKWTVSKIGEFFSAVWSKLTEFASSLFQRITDLVASDRLTPQEKQTLEDFKVQVEDVRNKIPHVEEIMKKYAQNDPNNTSGIRQNLEPLKSLAEGLEAVAA